MKSSTIRQILLRQEYCGDVVNFKTYSKSFKNKKRLMNPEENWKIFKDVHEPIIDRIEVYETEGTGKNKTQRIVIYYRFVGNIEIPSDEENLKMDIRQGMAVEYLTA